MPRRADSGVVLAVVTESVLKELLALAIKDADANEVTPPLGGTAGWNTARISWFRAYHRAATGLDGPAAEKTWAIYSNGQLAGSIRLRRSGPADGGAVETGIWLGRSMRGTGIGTAAVRLIKDAASAAGARELRAGTTLGNHAAQALLRAAGAELMPARSTGDGPDAPDATVQARIPLG